MTFCFPFLRNRAERSRVASCHVTRNASCRACRDLAKTKPAERRLAMPATPVRTATRPSLRNPTSHAHPAIHDGTVRVLTIKTRRDTPAKRFQTVPRSSATGHAIPAIPILARTHGAVTRLPNHAVSNPAPPGPAVRRHACQNLPHPDMPRLSMPCLVVPAVSRSRRGSRDATRHACRAQASPAATHTFAACHVEPRHASQYPDWTLHASPAVSCPV